jgi:hypothetical protein
MSCKEEQQEKGKKSKGKKEEEEEKTDYVLSHLHLRSRTLK